MLSPTWRRLPRWQTAVGLLIGAAAVVWLHLPLFDDLKTWGGHDWDAAQLFRYLVVKSIRTFHQFPFWNPWTCGGHDAWSYVESDSTLVSPLAPLFFLVDLRLAVRLETVALALIGGLGAWMLASRHTRSAAARTFVCVLFVLNGRWTAQAAAGHVWHLYYGYLPWALYFYERAHGQSMMGQQRGESWWKNSIAVAVVLALMIYAGALYPFPHTCLAIGLYALVLTIQKRTVKPLLAAGIAGVAGLGLAAPKLVPMMDLFRHSPRHIDSLETMDPWLMLKALTGTTPQPTSQWGWHEYAFYIGLAATLVVIAAAIFVRGGTTRAFRVIGVIFVVLAAGNFHEYSPWNLLHQLPVFKSQHVPSRFLTTGMLALSIIVAIGVERVRERRKFWSSYGEVLLLLGTALVAYDLADTNRKDLQGAFFMLLPPGLHVEEPFHQEQRTPQDLYYESRAWSTPAMPAAMANVGVVECTAVGTVGVFAPKLPNGEIEGRGAKGRGEPGYYGEYFTDSHVGTASVASFTPNVVEVKLDSARPGDLLVMNQNFDPGWTANGARAINFGDRVAARIGSSNETIVFRFRPRLFFHGLAIFVLTLGAIVAFFWRDHRKARGRSS